MTSFPHDPSTNPEKPAPGSGRRRRRRTDEVTGPSVPTQDKSGPGSQRRTVPSRGLIPSSWGLTPTFRVFLFLSAIVAVMSFLLYNEYLIGEVRQQERDRAELYANLYGLMVSEDAPPKISTDIFNFINDNSIDLPLIVTDHRNTIFQWKGTGLPDDDGLPETRRQLEEMMVKMDAVNEPVQALWTTQAKGGVYIDASKVIVTDPTGYPVAWAGGDLPDHVSASEPAPAQVANSLREMMNAGVERREFTAQAVTTCYLARLAEQFVIIEAGRPQPLAWYGADLPPYRPDLIDSTTAAIVRSRYETLAAREEPLTFQLHTEHVIHFGDTELLNRISLAPVVTLGVLCLFGLIGYVGFRNMRRSEQRSIWVGMAKETAHQLGTPLSSLSGWLELMQQRLADFQAQVGETEAEAVASIAAEMQRDMGRLNQIASRFSQIGSVPELRQGDLGEVITDTMNYFRGRGSQFGRHTFEADVAALPKIPLNAELMGWVFENLFKNAMDAMIGQDGQINVMARFDTEHNEVVVVVEDNGCGIKAEHLPRVFEPGFSTKKRGWGLGLAFVRRIIEEYHGGRIQVMQSERGQGTTFEISLPTS